MEEEKKVSLDGRERATGFQVSEMAIFYLEMEINFLISISQAMSKHISQFEQKSKVSQVTITHKIAISTSVGIVLNCTL